MKEEEKETKNEDALNKEDEGPKAEDSMPDVEEKQEAHMKEELEEEMNHQNQFQSSESFEKEQRENSSSKGDLISG